eukprot:TRINITY_DN35172_c0_g1_i1.p1 TRINITY_DN35172_c0_g1~~TRINITY_DN35172_c0_g1_i1.p1  ORF type:complete len:186 (-),score=24.85 TRINITY_DN35172_c0_g1_i1:220-777(-)
MTIKQASAAEGLLVRQALRRDVEVPPRPKDLGYIPLRPSPTPGVKLGDPTIAPFMKARLDPWSILRMHELLTGTTQDGEKVALPPLRSPEEQAQGSPLAASRSLRRSRSGSFLPPRLDDCGSPASAASDGRWDGDCTSPFASPSSRGRACLQSPTRGGSRSRRPSSGARLGRLPRQMSSGSRGLY